MKYKVVNNSGLEYLNIHIGDICTLHDSINEDNAWFHCESWINNGVWCLEFSDVEIIDEGVE